MKFIIPKNCNITDTTLRELKKQVKILIKDYELNKNREYKIYLYSNYLKIKYKNNYYNVTIVEHNQELYWYLRPFYNSYLLIKNTNSHCFDIILLIIKHIT